jgi:hypothetical protein
MERAEGQLRNEQSVVSALRSQIEGLDRQAAEGQAHASAMQATLEGLELSLQAAMRREDSALQNLAEAEREHREIESELRKDVQALRAAESVRRTESARLQERAYHMEARLGDLQHRLELELARSDALIGDVRRQCRRWWPRVGESLGLWRPPSAVKAICSYPAPATRAAETAGSDRTTLASPRFSAEEHQLHDDVQTYSLPELLSYDDAEFIRCAYLAILGRQPDAEGESYYLGRLRSGRAKLEILGQLRSSPEAINDAPEVAGLDEALRRFKLTPSRLIKRFVSKNIEPNGTRKMHGMLERKVH